MNQETALDVKTPAWMSELNPHQRLAVEHLEGPLLVLAGAGSGKTRVITYRIAYLIEVCGVSSWNILAVTFTNKAANEMKGRIVSLLGERAEAVLMSTFHSLCARILRRDVNALGISPDFTIYDETDSLGVVQEAKAAVASDCSLKPQRIRAKISAAKSEMMTPEDLAESLDKDYLEGQQLAQIYAAYEGILRSNQALDFDDLLLMTIRLLTEAPNVLERYQRRFRHVLVDEYQDTNSAQYKILKLLTGGSSNPDLCVVGDDDQSIYRWRGARLNNILDFEKDFPGTRIVRLEENYRSTQNILSAANAMVAHNQKRKGKTLWTKNVQGALLQLLAGDDEQQEAAQIVDMILRERKQRGTGTGIAVFYRTNSQSRALEEALTTWRVPYQIIGGTRFYERQEIKDALAYLRIVLNPRDNEAFKRSISTPRRGIGFGTIEKLGEWAAERGFSLLDACQAAQGQDSVRAGQRVALMRYAAQVAQWRKRLENGVPFNQVLDNILNESEYRLTLLKDPGEKSRVENLDAMLAGAAEFEIAYLNTTQPDNEETNLIPSSVGVAQAYVERASLMSAPDAMNEATDRVTLMTLHCAKGLEFPVVFLTGLEEGILPHSRCLDKQAALEEERRLCYVGMTRAKETLYLSFAWDRKQRYSINRSTSQTVSRFLLEIPKEFFDSRSNEILRRVKEPWRGLAQAGFERETVAPPRTSSPPRDFSSGAIKRRPTAQPVQQNVAAAARVTTLTVGDRIAHPSFGVGVVQQVRGSGDSLLATVRFQNGETKVLMPKFARLKKLK